MPTYEFRCPGANGHAHTFEARLPVDKRHSAVCPEHLLESTNRVFTAPAMIGFAEQGTGSEPDDHREILETIQNITAAGLLSQAQQVVQKIDHIVGK